MNRLKMIMRFAFHIYIYIHRNVDIFKYYKNFNRGLLEEFVKNF